MPLLSHCDESDVVKTSTSGILYSDQFSNYAFHGFTLNEVYSVDSPSSTDDLTFTHVFSAPALRPPASPNEKEAFEYTDETIERSYHNFILDISPVAYIVVVDWNL
jgi:hypothetical protein